MSVFVALEKSEMLGEKKIASFMLGFSKLEAGYF